MDSGIFRTGRAGLGPRTEDSLLSKIFFGMSGQQTSKRDKMFAGAAGKCPRHSFLVQTVPITETIGPSSQLYMNIGNAVHEVICDGMFKAGILLFKEYRVNPPKWLNLGGRIDALYDDDGHLAILEIKTCGNVIPTEPKEDHGYQAQVYSLITGIDRVNLLYASRDVGLPKPKMSVVPVPITQDVLTSIARKLVVASIGLREGRSPAIPAYFRPSSCKYCPFYTFCWDNAPLSWAGEDLDEDAWQDEINAKVAELVDGRQARLLSLVKHILETSHSPNVEKLLAGYVS